MHQDFLFAVLFCVIVLGGVIAMASGGTSGDRRY
jgi:fumarate reductase subunit C